MEFQNILQNIDIVIFIYKLLNIDDQLRLAQVNAELKHIFEKYIFSKENYDSVAVIGNNDYFIVTNETSSNRMALQPAELKEFLHYHRNKVKVFVERNGIVNDIEQFSYLTTLGYGFTKIPRKHLQFIAELDRVEELVINCCLDDEGKYIMVGKNWSVKSILPMKRLKSLYVNTPHGPSNWVPLSYGDFRQLVTQLKLEYLNLMCIVIPDYSDYSNMQRIKNRVHLKELNIGFKFIPNISDISIYLNIFENLVTFTMSVCIGVITDELLNQIADACPNLIVLNIESSSFRNVYSFSTPPKVTELSLSKCKGLTTDNLRQILRELKFIKFSSQMSHYEGEFGDFDISPKMQDLGYGIDFEDNFKLAFGGSARLKWLTWNNGGFGHNNIADDMALRKCINLEMLEMHSGFLNLSTLSHLKALNKLTIPPSMPPSDWSYIAAILQHPSLNEFVINSYCAARNLRNALAAPVNAFTTNVRILKITLEIFSLALDFWLDLFHQNQELQLEVYNFRGETEFMRTLVGHEKFPGYLRTLDICGFTIKCSELRRNLDATMNKVKQDIVHFKYESNDYLYRLLFVRRIHVDK